MSASNAVQVLNVLTGMSFNLSRAMAEYNALVQFAREQERDLNDEEVRRVLDSTQAKLDNLDSILGVSDES